VAQASSACLGLPWLFLLCRTCHHENLGYLMMICAQAQHAALRRTLVHAGFSSLQCTRGEGAAATATLSEWLTLIHTSCFFLREICILRVNVDRYVCMFHKVSVQGRKTRSWLESPTVVQDSSGQQYTPILCLLCPLF
jgi:hypothetical protein